MQKPKCPSCKSSQVYLRLKDQEFVCRSCGNVWKKDAAVSKVDTEK